MKNTKQTVQPSSVSKGIAKPNISGSGLKPILFSTEMVQAILNGRKTQTRRLIKPQPKVNEFGKIDFSFKKHAAFNVDLEDLNMPFLGIIDHSPFKVDQTLWVRETFSNAEFGGFNYRANYPGKCSFKWKPSLFMPYNACRLFLKVTNVKVQRLYSISNIDAINEGYDANQSIQGPYLWYMNLWSKINSVENLLSNPFVWVIDFKRCVNP